MLKLVIVKERNKYIYIKTDLFKKTLLHGQNSIKLRLYFAILFISLVARQIKAELINICLSLNI